MFAAGFAVMMIAGIATAQIGGFGEVAATETTTVASPASESEATSTTTERPIETPSDEKEAAEVVEEEKPQPNEEPGAEQPKKEPVADADPPRFEILHPVDGQVFEQKEVVFEGTAEPGARVFAGDYEADVRDDGSWRIVLWLQEGRNVATLEAIDEAGNVSTDSVTVTLEAPPKDEVGDKDHSDDESDKPNGEEPKEEPKEEEPKEEARVEFTIDQAKRASDSAEPYEVFFGTGSPGLVIELISPYGDKRVEVGESGKWEAKLVFHDVPAGKTFEIVVETSEGHRKVFTFTRFGEGEK